MVMNMEKLYVEKRASRGIATARAYKYLPPDLTPNGGSITKDRIAGEKKRFERAKAEVLASLEEMVEVSDIFAAHLEIAGDFTLQEGVEKRIAEEQKNAEMAVYETTAELAAMFDAMDDVYMKERSADILDIGKRFMACLKGMKLPELGDISEDSIIVARDLYPSDTVKLNPRYVKGILTEDGGVTSHVSIIAKSMDIPVLVGVQGILEKTETGMLLCMDAQEGEVIIAPNTAELEVYKKKQEAFLAEGQRLLKLRGSKVVTRDGKEISLCVNVGNIEDIKHALPMEIDGIGLFRSELLYMESAHFPTEEEQFAVYKQAARLCPKELTIRTLDIGGDKELPYFEFEKEENPFLGWRAIRISLDMRDRFKEQIRAILRASAFGHVRIMFPMIISMEELSSARGVVEECKQELREQGIGFEEEIETGMMIETPASVLLAEDFAKEADFFSIGTNDLTQYLLAVDRGNKKIADRYNYFHPAVLAAIEKVIEAGHKANIRVGMCGEMAGDVKAAALLLKMGLDEFSMSAGNMDYVRAELLEQVK